MFISLFYKINSTIGTKSPIQAYINAFLPYLSIPLASTFKSNNYFTSFVNPNLEA